MAAVSRGTTSHVTAKTAITSVDIQNVLCKAMVTHSESHATRVQWVCVGEENCATVTIVKHLGLISK